MRGLAGLLDDIIRAVSVRMGFTTKSVNEVVRDYNDALLRFAFDALNGRMDPTDFARAHKALIRKTGPDAYKEGMREGGIDDPDEELADDDEATIESWTDEQVDYVDDFADWLAESDNNEDIRRQLTARVDLWTNAVQTLGALGRASAKGDPMCVWHYAPEKEHCDTCAQLDGKRHRLSWFVDRNYIPQMPGAAMDCGGYYCGCTIEDVKTGRTLLPGG